MFSSRSKLKHFDKNVQSAKAELDAETGALVTVERVVQNAIQNSTRQINAFGNFLTIHKGRLVSDLNRIRELLTALQDKKCTKALNRKEVTNNHSVFVTARYFHRYSVERSKVTMWCHEVESHKYKTRDLVRLHFLFS